jgi:hypothetical protein
MFAFFLILLAIVSRVAPHPAWLNFTAVGGGLLYFGARRPLLQAVLPVALLAGTDYYLTAFVYRYPFQVQSYLLTWAWYAAVILLGAVMLKSGASAGRIVGASALSATSFFAISNFAVWASSGMYPHSAAGLATCYAAALPFYRNDFVSTVVVAGIAFATPQLAGWLIHFHAENAVKTA